MPADDSIRVLIADDHAVVRKGLAALVSTEPGLVIVGEAADGAEAIAAAASLRPDVIIMDMMMPNRDGIEAIEGCLGENPGIRILALTSSYDDRYVIPAIRAGALGYLLKESSPDELIAAIREVAEGRPFLQASLGARIVNQMADLHNGRGGKDPLTPRETDILRHIATGESNQEIAEALNLSERTVGKHVTNILDKLDLSNRTQAALYALRAGIARLDQTLD